MPTLHMDILAHAMRIHAYCTHMRVHSMDINVYRCAGHVYQYMNVHAYAFMCVGYTYRDMNYHTGGHAGAFGGIRACHDKHTRGCLIRVE